MAKKRITAICLQGGGALGAYGLGALKALYEVRGKDFKPHIVTGVSIGAVMAAIIAGAKNDDPIGTLEEVWLSKFVIRGPVVPSMQPSFHGLLPPIITQFLSSLDKPANQVMQLMHPIFGQLLPPLVQQNLWWLGSGGISSLRPEFLYMPLLAPFITSSFYDLSRLRETLTEFIDLDKLNDPDRIRVVTTAVNVRTSAGVNFDNKVLCQQGERFIFDHILASVSLPPYFPMIEIDGEYYWDGGIFANMPWLPALNSIKEIEPDNPDIERELIVVDLIPLVGDIPSNIVESLSRSTMIGYTDKFKREEDFFEKINSYISLVEQIDKDLPPDSVVRQHEGFKQLQQYKKIDHFMVFGENGPGSRGLATDYSEATIKSRIEAGYQDAKAQLAFNNEL